MLIRKFYDADTFDCGGSTKPFVIGSAIEKPPIGLMPKFIHREKRLMDVCGAISRYYNAGLEIPIEWVQEYNELVKSHCR